MREKKRKRWKNRRREILISIQSDGIMRLEPFPHFSFECYCEQLRLKGWANSSQKFYLKFNLTFHLLWLVSFQLLVSFAFSITRIRRSFKHVSISHTLLLESFLRSFFLFCAWNEIVSALAKVLHGMPISNYKRRHKLFREHSYILVLKHFKSKKMWCSLVMLL